MLIGYGKCHVIAETSVISDPSSVKKAVIRIAGKIDVDYVEDPQDSHLSDDQESLVGQRMKSL